MQMQPSRRHNVTTSTCCLRNASHHAEENLTQSNPGLSLTLLFGDMLADGSRQSGAWLYGHATALTSAAKDVITAKVAAWDAAWDADLHHLLNDHGN